MRHSRTVATAVALVALLAAGTAGAQAPKKGSPNNDKRATQQKAASAPDPIGTAAVADRLARYGEEKKDPVLLIAAARLKQDLAETSAEFKHKAIGGNDKSTKDRAKERTAEALLARARELSAGRADLVALADDVGKSRSRGVVGGYRYAYKTLAGLGRHVYTETFQRGEVGAVGISGDGDTDLDLYVYDEAGNLICRSENLGDDEVCRFTPYFTTPFRIVVVNRGLLANNYVMRTN